MIADARLEIIQRPPHRSTNRQRLFRLVVKFGRLVPAGFSARSEACRQARKTPVLLSEQARALIDSIDMLPLVDS